MGNRLTPKFAAGAIIVLLSTACATLNVSPESDKVRIVAAEAALADGDYAQAVEEYRRAALGTTDIATIKAASGILFEFGPTERAIEVIEHWASVAPDAAEPPLYLGRLALREDDDATATAYFLTFLSRNSAEEPVSPYDQLAGVLLGEGEPAQALAIAESLVAKYPGSWEAQRLLSRTAIRAEERNRAMEAAEESFGLAPDSFEAGLLQAQAIFLGGDHSAGLEFAAAISEMATTAKQRLEYAALLSASNEMEDAKAVVLDVLEDEPDSAEAIKALAVLEMRDGELDRAWELLTGLVEQPAQQHDAVFYLASIAERQGRTSQARRLYEQIGEGPNTILAQQRISQLLLRSGSGESEAVEYLEKFSREHPEYGFRLLLPRAALYRELGRYDDAIGVYDKILSIRPSSEGVLLIRAETLLSANRLDDAVSAYREALDEHPDSANSLNALGYTLADRTDRIEEAHDLIKRAFELEPENPAIIDSMGWVEFKRGNYEEALAHLEKAWDQLKDPEVAAHLGETLWRIGQKDRARQILKEGYDLAPGSRPLRETLERLQEEESRIES